MNSRTAEWSGETPWRTSEHWRPEQHANLCFSAAMIHEIKPCQFVFFKLLMWFICGLWSLGRWFYYSTSTRLRHTNEMSWVSRRSWNFGSIILTDCLFSCRQLAHVEGISRSILGETTASDCQWARELEGPVLRSPRRLTLEIFGILAGSMVLLLLVIGTVFQVSSRWVTRCSLGSERPTAGFTITLGEENWTRASSAGLSACDVTLWARPHQRRLRDHQDYRGWRTRKNEDWRNKMKIRIKKDQSFIFFLILL